MDNFVVCAVDIGSVRKGRLGWCRSVSHQKFQGGTDIQSLVNLLAQDLSTGMSIAIGFECPLFVPIPDDPILLTSQRTGEYGRPWSAGAGSAALATGLSESVWILEQIRKRSNRRVIPTLKWEEFRSAEANLLVWEAFVTRNAKSVSHQGDAETAVKTFWTAFSDISQATAVTADNPYCLIGAALLRAGMTNDLSILFQQCIVLKSS